VEVVCGMQWRPKNCWIFFGTYWTVSTLWNRRREGWCPCKGRTVRGRLVFPVYWNGENRRVGHWFARKGGLDWLPLREDVAEQLEIAYRSQGCMIIQIIHFIVWSPFTNFENAVLAHDYENVFSTTIALQLLGKLGKCQGFSNNLFLCFLIVIYLYLHYILLDENLWHQNQKVCCKPKRGESRKGKTRKDRQIKHLKYFFFAGFQLE